MAAAREMGLCGVFDSICVESPVDEKSRDEMHDRSNDGVVTQGCSGPDFEGDIGVRALMGSQPTS